MKTDVDLISVGEVLNTHGVKGEVKVRILTDFPERFKENAVFMIEQNGRTERLTVEYVRPYKNMLLVKFREIGNLTEAEAVKGRFLKISKDNLAKLQPDTYYIFDIIGMDVFTEDGQALGKVKDIFQTGSNDVYVVTGQAKEYLIPALKEIVLQVDMAKRTMTIRPLEGLLDL